MPILPQWVADLLHLGELFRALTPSGPDDKPPFMSDVIEIVELPASRLATMLSPSGPHVYGLPVPDAEYPHRFDNEISRPP